MIKLLTILILLAIVASLATGFQTTNQLITTDTVTKQQVANPREHKNILREYDLSSNRIVYVLGVIDEMNSPSITRQILEMGKDPQPITVVINSPGGSVIDGAEIISAMEAAKGPVNTLCVQLCASMAAIIHSYGTHRLMINHSLVMYHPASGGLQGEVDKMSSRLGTLKRYIDKLDANVARRSHISLEEFRQLYEVELWLDAEDAVQRGFADSVVFVRGYSANKLYPDFRSSDKVIRTVPNTPLVNNPFKLNWM